MGHFSFCVSATKGVGKSELKKKRVADDLKVVLKFAYTWRYFSTFRQTTTDTKNHVFAEKNTP